MKTKHAPDVLRSLIALEDILGHLLESSRIIWPQDDASFIYGKLEEAQAAIAETKGRND